MTLQELQDRFHAESKRAQEGYDAYMVENVGIRHIVDGKDITDVIREEMARACEILRVRFEYFDKLAAGSLQGKGRPRAGGQFYFQATCAFY
jgi:hypothetical protein